MKDTAANNVMEEPLIKLKKGPLITVTLTILLTYVFDLFVGSVTGVATPSIIAELGGMHFYALTITTFMLGGSIGRIVSGKLGDLYGRKLILQIALLSFAISSILCGLSNSIMMLVIFKALLGTAGGFLYTTCYAMIADFYGPTKRVKVLGYLASMIGVCYILGPLVGGYIVDTLSWRWLYIIPAPFLLLSSLLIHKTLPSVKKTVKVTIDYTGILLLCTAVVPFLLVLTWGGTKYSWGSPIMIVFYLISILSLIAFVYVERKAVEPLLPLSLLKNRSFLLPTFCYAIACYGVVIYVSYIPLYGQAVKGMSASASGSLITPLMIFTIISTQVTSMIIAKTGRYKTMLLFLFVWTSIIMYLISGFNENSSLPYLYSVLCMVGVSMGAFNVIFVTYLQNHLPHKQVGVATGALYFFGNIAGVIALSIAGLIMNTMWQIDKYMPQRLKEELPDSGINLMSSTQTLTNKQAAAELRSQLPSELHGVFDSTILEMKAVLVQIFDYVYLINAGLSILAVFVIAIFFKEKKVRKQKIEAEESV
ncbi:MFS transporter [Neobacillus vireti]|uniref:MFS transporter n=1 Tax=Neobacillus vireti TaxID=220686 RepID=UPI002FFEB7EA